MSRRFRLHAGGPPAFRQEFRKRCRDEVLRIAGEVAQAHGFTLAEIRAGKRGRHRSGKVIIARCCIVAALEDAGFTAENALHMDLFPGPLSSFKLCALIGHEIVQAFRSPGAGGLG